MPLDDREHAHLRQRPGGRLLRRRHPGALGARGVPCPYRGRSTPVNAWWGSFDLAVSLFSGRARRAAAHDFIMRNSMDAQEVAVGWWPGDARHGKPRSRLRPPRAGGVRRRDLSPAAGRWEAELGEYLLDWDELRSAADPRAAALEFARAVFRHACLVCGWDPALAATAEGTPPPVS